MSRTFTVVTDSRGGLLIFLSLKVALTLSLPESNLESINVAVPFESVDRTPVCDIQMKAIEQYVQVSAWYCLFSCDNFANRNSRFPRHGFELSTVGSERINRGKTVLIKLVVTSLGEDTKAPTEEPTTASGEETTPAVTTATTEQQPSPKPTTAPETTVKQTTPQTTGQTSAGPSTVSPASTSPPSTTAEQTTTAAPTTTGPAPTTTAPSLECGVAIVGAGKNCTWWF